MNELDQTKVSGFLPPAEVTHRDEMVSGIVWMQGELDEQTKTNAELHQKLIEATVVKRAVDKLDLDVEKSKVDVSATLEGFLRMFVSENTRISYRGRSRSFSSICKLRALPFFSSIAALSKTIRTHCIAQFRPLQQSRDLAAFRVGGEKA